MHYEFSVGCCSFCNEIIPLGTAFAILLFLHGCQLGCGKSGATLPIGEDPDSDNPLEAIDKSVRGRIAYDIPDSMEVDKHYRAEVSITKSEKRSILYDGIDANAPSDSIRVSSRMKVILRDPSGGENFVITALNSEKQQVDSLDNALWAWDIRPVHSGDHYLILTAVTTVYDAHGEMDRDITVFDRKFHVTNLPTLKLLSNFAEENWQWLAGSIVIPLFLFSIAKLRRKKA